MEDCVFPAPRPSIRGHFRFFVLFLPVAFLLNACASVESPESLRGEIVDSRAATGYTGEPRYFVTVECRESKGALSRLTFEVNREDWMRFHSKGEEVCLVPHLGGLRLSICR